MTRPLSLVWLSELVNLSRQSSSEWELEIAKKLGRKKTSLGHSEKCKGHAARIALIQRPPRIICSGFFRKLRLTLSRMPYFPSEFLRRESIPLADLSANFASEVCMIRTFQLLQKMSASKNLSLDIECPPPAKKSSGEKAKMWGEERDTDNFCWPLKCPVSIRPRQFWRRFLKYNPVMKANKQTYFSETDRHHLSLSIPLLLICIW